MEDEMPKASITSTTESHPAPKTARRTLKRKSTITMTRTIRVNGEVVSVEAIGTLKA